MFVGMVAQMPLRRRSRFVLAIVRDRCVSPLQRKYAQYENRDEAAHQRDSIIARTDGAHITFARVTLRALEVASRVGSASTCSIPQLRADCALVHMPRRSFRCL